MKKFYEHRDYESVDEKSLYPIGHVPKSDEKSIRAQMG